MRWRLGVLIGVAACDGPPAPQPPPEPPAERALTRVLKRPDGQTMTVELPARLSDGHRVSTHGVTLQAVLEGHEGTPSPQGEDVVYADGAVRYRFNEAGGLEDWVVSTTNQPLRYRLVQRGGGGYHASNGRVVVVDHEGYPRLQVTAPTAIDANGKRLTGRVSLTDCAYDRGTAPPWWRPPTPADACTLVVTWDHAKATAPVTVDPLWEPVLNGLPEGRHQQAAAPLPSGDVLIVGGCTSGTVGITDSCAGARAADTTVCTHDGTTAVCMDLDALGTEPTLAGHTLTVLETPAGFEAIALGGTAEAAVGDGTNGVVSRLNCDAQNCSWSQQTNTIFGPARRGHTATVLGDGRIAFAGGRFGGNAALDDVTLYDPATDTWSSAPPLAGGRAFHTATSIGPDEMVVAGGFAFTSSGSGDKALPNAHVYSATQGPTTTIPLASARALHRAVRVDDAVLVIGGTPCGASNLGTNQCAEPTLGRVERLDVTNVALGWRTVPGLNVPRQSFALLPLPNGWLGAVGGSFCVGDVCIALDDIEVRDPESGRWSSAGEQAPVTLAVPREGLVAAPLGTGSALVTGGRTSLADSPVTLIDAIETLDLFATGEDCVTGGICATGHCVTGRCCATPCDTPCRACDEQGQCLVAPDGADPQGRCAADACSVNNQCIDGQCVFDPNATCGDPARCTGDARLVENICREDNGCTEVETNCGRFRCIEATEGARCPDACATDDDCISGAICEGGVCVDGCLGDDQLITIDEDGETSIVSCGGYACRRGTCLDRCDGLADCAGDNLCNRDNRCVPPTTVVVPDGGCGCGLGPPPDHHGRIVLGVLALAAGWSRRRGRDDARSGG